MYVCMQTEVNASMHKVKDPDAQIHTYTLYKYNYKYTYIREYVIHS